jgi:hypothetical protein
MTAIHNIAGCSICGGLPPLCLTCTLMDRVLNARPDEPLSVEWAQAQECPAEAKRVLLALIRKTDLETGFSQLSLPIIAREACSEPRPEFGDGYRIVSNPELYRANDETAARWAADRLRLLVAEGLLETYPALPNTPWVLRWLTLRRKSPDAIVWFRLKRKDMPRQWENVAA